MAYVYNEVNWEDLPSTNTPRNATNLGNMDTGIKENNNMLNGTKPMGSIVVDDVKCKNLVQSFTNGTSSTQYSMCLYCLADLKPNTTYTIQFKGANGHEMYFNENLFTSNPRITCDGTVQSRTLTTLSTLPTPTNDGYGIAKNFTGNTVTPNFNDVQIEIGSETTSYTPYKAFATEYKWDVLQNQDVAFTNTTQFFNITNINKYDRIRVAVNNSYNRTFYFYFEKNDLIGNSNLFQTLLSMPNGELASLALGRITLDIVNDAIGVVYDKSNATFPLTLKNIVGYYRGEQTSSSTSGTRMLSVESEGEEENR